jgi:hypothetical protein
METKDNVIFEATKKIEEIIDSIYEAGFNDALGIYMSVSDREEYMIKRKQWLNDVKEARINYMKKI